MIILMSLFTMLFPGSRVQSNIMIWTLIILGLVELKSWVYLTVFLSRAQGPRFDSVSLSTASYLPSLFGRQLKILHNQKLVLLLLAFKRAFMWTGIVLL